MSSVILACAVTRRFCSLANSIPGLRPAVAASVFTRLEKLLDQRDFGHPQVATAMLLALLERAPYRVHTLGFSTRAGEIDATATIIRRGFLGIDER